MINIILCGGAGTRLWPLSTPSRPKQFCDLLGGPTLFERTVARNAPLSEKLIIVTNASHIELAAAQAESAAALAAAPATAGAAARQPIEFILEPVGRNTAPAIALACLAVAPEEIVLVTPSDHIIDNEPAYREAVSRAALAAADGRLATFGLAPAYPETGYGYIEIDRADPEGERRGYWRAASFREKPDRATAERYIADGRFYWNSGMFCFKAGVFLEELRRHAPDIYAAAEAANLTANRTSRASPAYPTISLSETSMTAIRAESIDYAVMERTDRAAVVPCSIGWSDLGSWDAIFDARAKDRNGNAAPPETQLLDAARNLVLSDTRRVALIGVEDLIVIETEHELLIATRGASQRVKEIKR